MLIFKNCMLLMVALMVASGFAAAQVTCNSFLTTNASLTSDLNCTSGFTAIEIATDDVTLDLNGFTLSGTILQAVFVSGDRVTIRGPGRIQDFDIGIQSVDTRGLRIEGVEFVSQNTSIVLTGTRNALIRRNRVEDVAGIGVSVIGFDNGIEVLPSRNNRILNNRMTRVGRGVQICGFNATEQRVANNRFRRIVGFAVQLESGTNNNRVENNRFVRIDNTGVRITNSNNNQVRDNKLENGRFAISIHDNNGALNPNCAAAPVLGAVTGNLIENNRVGDFEIGVALGLGNSMLPKVIANRIGGNTFSNNQTGLFLRSDAWANDATGNLFPGTTTPVLDSGTANVF